MKTLAFRFSILTITSFVVLAVTPTALYSENFSDEFLMNACKGATGNEDCTTSGGQDPESSILNTLDAALSIISFVVGAAAVIALIIGGLRFITASGDPQAIATARSSIIYAIVGLIVALVAQGIVQFVLEEV